MANVAANESETKINKNGVELNGTIPNMPPATINTATTSSTATAALFSRRTLPI
jgi:hypothetical protein